MSALRVRRFCAAADAALHYRRAARMYRYAPINAAERHESRVRVGAGTAVATAPVKEEFCHTAGGLHGSGYFKLLDDAAFFAAHRVLARLRLGALGIRLKLRRQVEAELGEHLGEQRQVGADAGGARASTCPALRGDQLRSLPVFRFGGVPMWNPLQNYYPPT